MENNKAVVKDILFFLLKVILVILLILAALVIGIMLGYSVIGDGGSPWDVFNPDLWSHIFNFFM